MEGFVQHSSFFTYVTYQCTILYETGDSDVDGSDESQQADNTQSPNLWGKEEVHSPPKSLAHKRAKLQYIYMYIYRYILSFVSF